MPFHVVPVEAAAKATRFADVVITDGQGSSDEEEPRHLADGYDLVLLPTAPKARAVELTVELAQLLQRVQVPHAVLLVKVDLRQQRAAQEARQALQAFALQCWLPKCPCLPPSTIAVGPIPAAWPVGRPTSPLPRRLNA